MLPARGTGTESLAPPHAPPPPYASIQSVPQGTSPHPRALPTPSLPPPPPVGPEITTRVDNPNTPDPPSVYTIRSRSENTGPPPGRDNAAFSGDQGDRDEPPPPYSFPAPPPPYTPSPSDDETGTEYDASNNQRGGNARNPDSQRLLVLVRETNLIVLRLRDESIDRQIFHGLWLSILFCLLGGIKFGIAAIIRNRQAKKLADAGSFVLARLFLKSMWRWFGWSVASVIITWSILLPVILSGAFNVNNDGPSTPSYYTARVPDIPDNLYNLPSVDVPETYDGENFLQGSSDQTLWKPPASSGFGTTKRPFQHLYNGLGTTKPPYWPIYHRFATTKSPYQHYNGFGTTKSPYRPISHGFGSTVRPAKTTQNLDDIYKLLDDYDLRDTNSHSTAKPSTTNGSDTYDDWLRYLRKHGLDVDSQTY